MIFNKLNFTLILNACVVSTLLISLESCSYSFTGASVASHLKTISIPIVKDKSGSGEPNLENNLTNELIQKFIDDNTFSIAEKAKADAVLECVVVSIPDSPEAVTGVNEKATLRRITMSIKVVYKDLVKKKTIFERTISEYSTYDTQNFIESRNAAILSVVDKITEDILLAVVSNW
jgi:hypothetical protein